MGFKQRLRDITDYAEEHDTFNRARVVRQAENVCVFGLGKYFRDAFVSKNMKGTYHVNLLSDNDSKLWGNSKEGLPVIAPEKLKEIKDLVVIIMVGDPLAIEKQLDELGVRWVTHEELTVDDELGLCKDPQWFALQRERIIDGVDDFEDERSKEIYTECLARRIAYPLAEKTYEELCSMPEYFGTDVLPLSDGETYVDCGAYDGDTIVEFIGQTGGYRHIYGFELDKNNFQKCAARFFGDRDITLFQKGVWDQNTTADCSHGEMVRLDDVLEGVPVSLIKIDVEGAEDRALRGAKTLIKTCKPKLAVCVYHKTSDFWELPRYIKQLDESYRIFLRHHSRSSGLETVLYAL